MEKPSGLIEKVIDTLHLVNNIQGPYSLIEKDIILQHIRAAYLQLINYPAVEEVDRETIILPTLESEPNAKLESYIEQINELNLSISQLEKELEESNSNLASQQDLLQSEQLKQVGFELQIREQHKTIDNQKKELETLIALISEKDQQLLNLKNGYEVEIDEQRKAIAHLKQELEMVLLREDQYEQSIAESEEPVFEEPVVHPESIPELNIVPDPIVEPELIVIPEPVVVPEPVVAPEPVKIQQSEPKQEQTLEGVDDILEFINPNAPKQETAPTSSIPQPLLFVEEKETLKTEKKSLNDLLTEKKEDNSIGSRFQQAKIQDLTKAISINDKFLFIRELFKSKGEEFSTSLHRLNNCANIEEAFNVMEELKNYYFWDTTSSAYLSLCDLVRRKFL